jgi:hypothetical protein
MVKGTAPTALMKPLRSAKLSSARPIQTSYAKKVGNVFQKVGCATLTQIVVLETLQTRVLIVSIPRVSRLSTLVTVVKDAFALITFATESQIAWMAVMSKIASSIATPLDSFTANQK